MALAEPTGTGLTEFGTQPASSQETVLFNEDTGLLHATFIANDGTHDIPVGWQADLVDYCP